MNPPSRSLSEFQHRTISAPALDQIRNDKGFATGDMITFVLPPYMRDRTIWVGIRGTLFSAGNYSSTLRFSFKGEPVLELPVQIQSQLANYSGNSLSIDACASISASYAGQSRGAEMLYADNFSGTRHMFVPWKVRAEVDRVIWNFDKVFATSSAVGTLFCLLAVRSEVRMPSGE